MTVLLIDLSGHKKELEVPALYPYILYPLSSEFAYCVYNPQDLPSLRTLCTCFTLSPEPSWPTVYRQCPNGKV